jgi:ATP-binding cassette, subfamily C, bacterial CydC
MRTLHRLLRLAPAPRGRLGLAALLGALTVLLGVGLMASAGYLISRAAEHPAVLSLTGAIVAVRFFGLARPLARYFERLAGHDLAFRVLGRVRVRVYERIERLSAVQLASRREGDLLSGLVADVDALQNLYLRALGPPLVALLAGAVAAGAAAAVLPPAGLVLAAGLVIGALAVPAAAGGVAARAGRGQADARSRLTADLVEVLAGGPELAVYGREDEALRRLRADDAALVRSAHRGALAGGLGDGLTILVTGATVAGVLAVAVAAHEAGRLDRVLVGALALLALAAFEAIQPLSQAARDLSGTLAAGRRLLQLTDLEPLVSDPERPARPPEGPFAIELTAVHARYGADQPAVLDGLDLRLEPGARVALVGPSGSGKTTVANLLLRFLDPDEGSVTLAGRDLREYRQEDVRRLVAVAGHDSHLFSASIRENVRLARPDATDTELESALRRAQTWRWVQQLPDGWDTLVGEAGRELSGGQRQRLVLARALLADTPVLVLDEPTAHLDRETARALVEDVFAAAGDAAVLLITHRPEGLELVDEVVRLPATATA